MHLPAVGVPEPIRAQVGFYFSATSPVRTPAVILLGDKTIDIPAGDRRHIVEDEYRLPVDVEALAVYPHAHFLGADLQAFATLLGGLEGSTARFPRRSRTRRLVARNRVLAPAPGSLRNSPVAKPPRRTESGEGAGGLKNARA